MNRILSFPMLLAVATFLAAGPATALASGAPPSHVSAAITRRTPIADSARSIAVARGVELAQPTRSRPPRAVRCTLGLTLLPLTTTFVGMLVGATGALVAGGGFPTSNSEGIVRGATVVGAALGLAAGMYVCVT